MKNPFHPALIGLRILLLFTFILLSNSACFSNPYLNGRDLSPKEAQERISRIVQYLPDSPTLHQLKMLKAALTGGRDSSEIYLFEIPSTVNYQTLKSVILGFNRKDYSCQPKENPYPYTITYPNQDWFNPHHSSDMEFISVECGEPAGFGYRFFLSEKDRLLYLEAWSS